MYWRTVAELTIKERELIGKASTSAKVTWWYIASSSGNGSRNAPDWLTAILFVVASGLLAIFGFKVQTSANNYLRAKYPGAATRGWTIGEVIATVLGVLLLALVVAGAFLPSS